MYALINIPGSSCFAFYGPAAKADCKSWLEAQKIAHQERHGGLWMYTYYPARVVSNNLAESMRWADGSRIIRREDDY